MKKIVLDISEKTEDTIKNVVKIKKDIMKAMAASYGVVLLAAALLLISATVAARHMEWIMAFPIAFEGFSTWKAIDQAINITAAYLEARNLERQIMDEAAHEDGDE